MKCTCLKILKFSKTVIKLYVNTRRGAQIPVFGEIDCNFEAINNAIDFAINNHAVPKETFQSLQVKIFMGDI